MIARVSRYRTPRCRAWRAFDATVAPIALPAARSSCRILGLDPGSQRTGFGLIDFAGGDYVHRAHGCIDARAGELSQRLRLIFEAVERLVAEHRPDEVAIERVFVNRNVDSALKLGQARGAALCAVPVGTPVFEYAPRAIKLALVGFGGAEKRQVGHMIRALLRLEERITADASDALAIAICHAHSRRLHALAEAGASR
jgi:crossover junction endodeoxyribonuclease RuvC